MTVYEFDQIYLALGDYSALFLINELRFVEGQTLM